MVQRSNFRVQSLGRTRTIWLTLSSFMRLIEIEQAQDLLDDRPRGTQIAATQCAHSQTVRLPTEEA